MTLTKSLFFNLVLLLGIFLLFRLEALEKWQKSSVVKGRVIALEIFFEDPYPIVFYEIDGMSYIHDEPDQEFIGKGYKMNQAVKLLVERDLPKNSMIYRPLSYWLHPPSLILYFLAVLGIFGARHIIWSYILDPDSN